MAVVVVGAGIAGIACARELQTRGVDVRVLERAGHPGGRMASPTLHGRPVDLGAAYLTTRDPEFTRLVQGWAQRGLARPWTDTFAVAGGEPTTGPVRWAAPHGLGSLVADLARGLDIEFGRTVERVGPGPVVDGERADAVVLAMPDPQARRLHDGVPPAQDWEPVVAVVAGWARRCWPEFAATFVNDHPVLSFVADDGSRRGDGAPVLVAHTTALQARAHDADPAGAVPAALQALRELLDVPPPVWTHARLWRHARPGQDRDAPFHLGTDGVGLAGDGWGSARVETAWRSGFLLGRILTP
ncbi:NAD(P)/FAD-dependent oxidoreductase [Pseudonocardia sp.]|uniref:NAD(P)/FAD-dependent oxidoreductase n=1 Tax=Pseudonocardia sp. TaxID=60912 RepID=UPI003D0ED8D1